MKNFCAISSFVIAIGVQIVSAQTAPKLAIAGVTVAPTLAEQFNISTAGDTNSPVQVADLIGVWNGDTHSNGKSFPYVLTITKAADGSKSAEFSNVNGGHVFKSILISIEGSHVTITFHNGKVAALLAGNLDGSRSTMQMKWRPRPGEAFAGILLERSQTLSSSSPNSGTPAPPVNLDAISHNLNVQLADTFEADHAFSVLESDDLESAIPPKENSPYNLKDSDTANQFKQAGISYLLLTSLEELKNDKLDKAQGTLAYQTASAKVQGSGRSSRNGAELSATASGMRTQEKFEPNRVIEQDVYLMVRCRLFDVASGELLDSGNYSFSTNHIYAVLANGNKESSEVDLFEAAAKNIAEHAVAKEREAILKHAQKGVSP